MGSCTRNFIKKGQAYMCLYGEDGVLEDLSCRVNKIGICSDVDCCEEIDPGFSYDFDY